MKSQKSEVKSRNTKIVFFMFLLLLTVHCALLTSASADKWGGVDESVVERYAEEHGREAVDPVINTDQGDLLLFVFLLAGAVGGFVAGYYWRTLTESAVDKNTSVRLQEREL